MSEEIIRVLLVDDHTVVRSGLCRLLEQHSGIKVVAEAESGEQAYQVFGEYLPDVTVMDLSMPGMGGLEAMRRILARYRTARVLIFSMHENAAFAMQTLKSGARGYVAKTGSFDELVKAVVEVARGKSYISTSIAQKIALQTVIGDGDLISQLSPREFEVFRLFAEGKNAEEIAEVLKISQKTVANYHTLVKQKLGLSNPVEMVRFAIKHGLIDS
ncbi:MULTISPECIES: response regulator transcription factor [Methylovorus]|uniref:Two component transcriptional regulator, LuxR family n=1 Tax=Methylovorus glucosotrophus (strain SIP3-4) TaxID=582744 RepID=C6XAP6_METGS|nr:MULTISPECIES: response regulator transcription factor [Methylovorus]ACT49978.1 two component transcriptional regulator, LuxR family [Methylovorus glucosotrophus SIP3-4]ADQ83940.1 two component transcriptional regulator, LuxR family [Methylovorus sp. MP688]KAF0844678.1 LuxR family two component transcriptional regulator [Methylovorus glucosotrophus]